MFSQRDTEKIRQAVETAIAKEGNPTRQSFSSRLEPTEAGLRWVLGGGSHFVMCNRPEEFPKQFWSFDVFSTRVANHVRDSVPGILITRKTIGRDDAIFTITPAA